MTAAGRARREQIRLRAADLFARGMSPPEVVRRLWVSRTSAYAWHQRWEAGGLDALRSVGPGSRCRLDDEQRVRLAAELDRGPVAHGWTVDQRWTLGRFATLIARLFGVSYTLTGVDKLLYRMGYSA
ncbi:helix-turn-helix domain-containing protein [Frankia sp. AvcI1]|uniref:helix-turn-helix domain-containing protein n=1 Tax=Frankia sp. AvcI1 TaxID=573496 RepID=UPI002117D548|nr:helix-turn-helix domain-containing protein [Frankia sp. AvcI1]